MKELKRVPKLRFTEFEKDWKKSNLNKLSRVASGGTPNRSKENYWNGNIPWVTTSLLNLSRIKEAEEFITEEGMLNSSAKLFPKGTILMAMYGQGKTRGKVSILEIEATTNQACAAIIVKEIVNNQFLLHYLKGQYEIIRGLSNEGGQKNLSGALIKSIKITYPELPEQQKIASFLSSVDKKTDQLHQKKSLLEQYKKGVMQKLFSQELRFKDENGNDYPTWEEKKLGQIAIKTSSNISANTIEENFGEYKIYGASGYLKSIDFYREEDAYISIVKDGAGVGRTLLCEAKSSVLGTLDIIKPKSNVNLYFIYSLLNNINFTKYITGSTIPHIYFKDYSKEKIEIPVKEEQTKIANFLSAIDKKIESVNAQIETTQEFKKGLLQQMFV